MPLSMAQGGYVYGPGTPWAQRALAGVDVEIAEGGLVLVVGATGSGKSTLLQLLTGLLEPTEGEVTLDGEPLTPARARGTVGLVFQDPEAQLFAETVLEDVSFGPRNLGRSDAQVRADAIDAMSVVGLEPESFSQRSPFSLSGGEARRVALAGVLAMQPSYLLLDEPTAGLDAGGRMSVMQAIDRARSRAGIVVVTHDIEEFLGHADRVLVLSGGRSAFWGPASQLLESPGVLDAAGLCVPPVLSTLHLARQRGADVPLTDLDPVRVARALLDACGGCT